MTVDFTPAEWMNIKLEVWGGCIAKYKMENLSLNSYNEKYWATLKKVSSKTRIL